MYYIVQIPRYHVKEYWITVSITCEDYVGAGPSIIDTGKYHKKIFIPGLGSPRLSPFVD